jgi:hypothetical protein
MALLLTEEGEWTDDVEEARDPRAFNPQSSEIHAARMIRSDLRQLLFRCEYEKALDALAKLVVEQTKIRQRVLQVAIRLGLPGSEKRLAGLLATHGDRGMTEDFLNCGSETLREAAWNWARTHGYSIASGGGSRRAQWGKF